MSNDRIYEGSDGLIYRWKPLVGYEKLDSTCGWIPVSVENLPKRLDRKE